MARSDAKEALCKKDRSHVLAAVREDQRAWTQKQKLLFFIAVRCAEQQFQVAQHRTTIRPETRFGKDALPQESFDLSPAAKKDSSYVA